MPVPYSPIILSKASPQQHPSRNLSCNSVCTSIYGTSIRSTVLMVRTYEYFGPSLHAEHYFYRTVP